MNEFDLLKAMSDLDDSLLASTHHRPQRGMVILAAVIALLSVTAAATSFGAVTFQRQKNIIDTEESNLSEDYYGELPQYVSFEEILFSYDLKPQLCKDSYYEAIYPALKADICDRLAGAKTEGKALDPNEVCICTSYLHADFVDRTVFTAFEEQSGIALSLTSKMLQRQALAKDIVWEDIFYPTDQLDIQFHYLHSMDSSTGSLESVTPVAILLEFHMGGYEMADDYAVCHIRIPLNERGVADLQTSTAVYFGEEGALHTEEVLWGSIPMLLVYTTDTSPGYTGRAEAHFCINGIGYFVSAYDKNGDGDAMQMLLELLKDYQ